MSELERLIRELCPNGVELRKIKEVYKRIKGTPITAGKMKEIENPDGDIRVFAGGKTVINAFEEDIPNANITRVPAVLVQSRGVIDAVYYDIYTAMKKLPQKEKAALFDVGGVHLAPAGQKYLAYQYLKFIAEYPNK